MDTAKKKQKRPGYGATQLCVGINLAMGFVFSFLYAMGVSLGYGGFFSPLLPRDSKRNDQ
ncbi:MAG: hypothetical protein QF687_05780 [Nitrospinaceae bacterium]|nr:hypothetical protein [Nitrospinaceae bacterium]